MTVEEQQPEATAPIQRQQVAEQDRAVATKHDRLLAAVEHIAGCVAQLVCVVTQPCRVEQPGTSITPRVIGRGHDASRAPRVERAGEPGIEQRAGKALDTAGEEPRHGRRLDDCVAGTRHSLTP